jgi:hypothetical protein
VYRLHTTISFDGSRSCRTREPQTSQFHSLSASVWVSGVLSRRSMRLLACLGRGVKSHLSCLPAQGCGTRGVAYNIMMHTLPRRIIDTLLPEVFIPEDVVSPAVIAPSKPELVECLLFEPLGADRHARLRLGAMIHSFYLQLHLRVSGGAANN